VESIVRELAGVETEDVRPVLDRVQAGFENLPGRAIADLPALSQTGSRAYRWDTLARLGSQPDAGRELEIGEGDGDFFRRRVI